MKPISLRIDYNFQPFVSRWKQWGESDTSVDEENDRMQVPSESKFRVRLQCENGADDLF